MSDEPYDLEVGRYALRTFRPHPSGKLASLFTDFTWDKGTAIAACRRREKETGNTIVSTGGGWVVKKTGPPDDLINCAVSPSRDCTCGLYGSLTIDQLVREYDGWVARCGVAVIAAEGTTYIGTKGLRTSAARVVAWWHPNSSPYHFNVVYFMANIFSKECQSAKRYDCIYEMLQDYNFPQPSEETSRAMGLASRVSDSPFRAFRARTLVDDYHALIGTSFANTTITLPPAPISSISFRGTL